MLSEHQSPNMLRPRNGDSSIQPSRLANPRQVWVSHHCLCFDLVFTENANRLGKHVSKRNLRSKKRKMLIPVPSSPVPCLPRSERMLLDI